MDAKVILLVLSCARSTCSLSYHFMQIVLKVSIQFLSHFNHYVRFISRKAVFVDAHADSVAYAHIDHDSFTASKN